MMNLLMWVEHLSYSTWVRESDSLLAFPMFLFLHTLGMALLAGGSAVIDLALLGLWPKTPLRPLGRLFPLLLWAFAINAFTGISIYMKDASTYSRNPDFYIKLIFIVLAMVLLFRIRRQVFGDPELDTRPLPSYVKTLAWASLICWFGAIVTGRLIAYVGPVAGL